MAVEWSSIKGLLIDLDGVVFTGRLPIEGAPEFLAQARQQGMRFQLITNNSTTAPELVAQRLRGMDIQVEPHEILTSAQAAVAYVKQYAEPGARVRVVGEAGLRQAAEREGFSVLDDGNGRADWVIVGLDRAFTYEKLARAARDIMHGAHFVATNTDALLPVEDGQFVPGAGTMVAAVQTATAVNPVVLGKPEPGLFDVGLRRLGGLMPHQAAMIGDRLDTDIAGAQRAGLRAILVLSGVTSPEEAAAAASPPDAMLANLASVAGLLGWS
jgi:4-nitrophenyl phosphatase